MATARLINSTVEEAVEHMLLWLRYKGWREEDAEAFAWDVVKEAHSKAPPPPVNGKKYKSETTLTILGRD
jgi:hypothetical protein